MNIWFKILFIFLTLCNIAHYIAELEASSMYFFRELLKRLLVFILYEGLLIFIFFYLFKYF